MGNNPSVRQFRADMQDFVNKAKRNFHQEILSMADEVVGNMQRAIPHSVSGNLKKSIRKKDVSTSDESQLSVLVMAGGHLTIKREKSGAHDYSLDEEFGSRKETPRPFFYNTYRLYIQGGLEQFRETLDETIEENNKVRDLRAWNYSNFNLTISSGHGGAVVIQKGQK